jgi:hypothetical protein
MSSSNLIRWSGLAALIGGVTIAILDVLEFVLYGGEADSVAAATSTFAIMYVLYMVATVLIFLGLVGLYAHQAEKAGTFGVVAFVAAVAGMVMMSGFLWSALTFGVWLAEVAPEIVDSEPTGVAATMFMVTLALFALGWILFGIASLRASVLNRIASVVLIVGSVWFFVAFMIGFPATVIFAIGLAWLGYSLWSIPSESAALAQEVA